MFVFFFSQTSRVYTKQHNFKGLRKRTKHKKYSEIQAHNQCSNQWADLIRHEKSLQNKSVVCRKHYLVMVLQDTIPVPLREATGRQNTRPIREWWGGQCFRKKVLTVCGCCQEEKQALSTRSGSDIYSLFWFSLYLNPLIPFFSSTEGIKLGKSASDHPESKGKKKVKIKSLDDPTAVS